MSLPAARCRPLVPRRRPERAEAGLVSFLAPIHPSTWRGDGTRTACMIPHNPGPIGCETPDVACSHRCRDACPDPPHFRTRTRAGNRSRDRLCAGRRTRSLAGSLRWPDHFAGRIIGRAAPFGGYHPAPGEASSLQTHERAGRSGAGPNRSKWPREPSRVSPRDLTHTTCRESSAPPAE